MHAQKYAGSPWLSFGTIQRKDKKQCLSCLMESLMPTIPVLPVGIFRCSRAAACVCIGASPNEDYYITWRILRLLIPVVNKYFSLLYGVKHRLKSD